ncbi:MAG: 1-(5-phosphoribosyl)-5-[(5-phosphoribosylamino)methylideneamino]imidazole-4-carboxamide isomerase [Bacteroidales bacterium]
MRIISAIDLIEGKCVRLCQGDYSQTKIYSNNPVEQAKIFEDIGFSHLHLVDLDGAKNGQPKNIDILNKISTTTRLKIDFGGGIRSSQSAMDALNAGANQINIGTALITNASFTENLIAEFGFEKIIAALDSLNLEVKTHGWSNGSSLNIIDVIKNLQTKGIVNFTVTDIGRDGMLTGPSVLLYQSILESFPNINLIASGGVSSMNDIKTLSQLNIDGVIVGKAIYENKLNLEKLTKCYRNE